MMRLTTVLLVGLWAAQPSLANPLSKRDDLNDCLQAANVPHHQENSTAWNRDARPFNERLYYEPAAIAVPRNTSEIQAAVACGARYGVKVAAKCGGHSYASFGLGGADGHLVLELDGMHKVTVGDNGRATIQGGARLGHVAVELFAQGGRAIPHGTCPGVGISGHGLHGGYGMASHTHGLTLDWMVGATVVLANATRVHCSATENADLFWALRGAGSSFGIVSEFEFNTFAAPRNVTYYTINVSWNRTTMVSGLKALQDFAETMPAELNMRAAVGPSGTSFEGVYYGNTTQLSTAVAPLLTATRGRLGTSRTVGWIAGLEHYAYGLALNQTENYNQHETFYSSSLTAPKLTDAQIEAFAEYVYEGASTGPGFPSWWLQIDLHGGANSAISKVATASTAYAHRDRLLLFQLYDRRFTGTYPESGFGLVQGFRTSITDEMEDNDWGMYINYADTQLDSPTAQRLYWGSNLARLRQIKRLYDPNQVFWNPQSITPSA